MIIGKRSLKNCRQRVETSLRSTTSAEPFNSLDIIHNHKTLTENLNLRDIAIEFLSKSDSRRHFLGNSEFNLVSNLTREPKQVPFLFFLNDLTFILDFMRTFLIGRKRCH